MTFSPSRASARGPHSLPRIGTGAFTLVELMVAVTIFVMMLGLFTTILNTVYRGWETAKRQTEISQNARAILGLLEQDLTPALVSKRMQFGAGPDLSEKLPAGETVVENSGSLFWWAPASTSDADNANLAQVGWYLVKGAAGQDGNSPYRLQRFYRRLAPDASLPSVPADNDLVDELYWLEALPGTGAASLDENSRVVSDLVLGLWVECLDSNGAVIPRNSTGKLAFNSAERFQMAPAGQAFESGKTFHYTASTTLLAHRPPAAVRVTILITDSKTFVRHASIPAPPTPGTEESVDEVVAAYRSMLWNSKIQTTAFATTVRLATAAN